MKIVGIAATSTMDPEKFGGNGKLSDTTPSMNGEGSPGKMNEASRADHIHPTDTSRMPADISVLEAVAGDIATDYKFPVSNRGNVLRSVTWEKIVENVIKAVAYETAKAIEESHKTAQVEAARAVCTEDGTIYATLPEGMTEDAVLVLQSDLLKYYTISAIDTIVARLQPKGDYLVPQNLTAHNTGTDSHNDIRLLIEEIASWIRAFADIDDESLNQMSEVTAYIKDNRNLIEKVTTLKVSVTDIIDNLSTNVINKPLSAAQGVALKALIDAITVPTKLSELSGDATHRTVTDDEKTAWNAKSNFSGKYSDLTGKPTIPSSPSDINAQPAGSYVTSDKTVTLTGVDENGTTHTWVMYGVKS